MEYLDIVDENNNLTGEKEERSIIHKNSIWHREIAVWIINENGEILLQKRSATKKQKPNKWSVCAGHIDAGETVESATLRELEEELGVKATIDELEYLNTYKKEYPNNHNFQYVYLLKTNNKVEDYKIQEEELSKVKYISFEELENIVKTKDENVTFSSHAYMIDLIEKLRSKIER